MKLKYYLRGLGLGIVLTAIIMGVVLGKNNSKMSDEEIKKRAKQLGMVEAESTLSSYLESSAITEDIDEANSTASDTQMVEEGKEVPEEDNEAESSTGESVSEVGEVPEEIQETGENSESIESEEDVKLASDDAAGSASTDTIQAGQNEARKPESETVESQKTGEEGTKSETAEAQKTESEVTETAEPEKAEPEVTETAEAQKTESEVAETAESVNNEPVNENNPVAEQTSSSDTSYVVVVLPSGSDSDDCARILREAGLISDGVEYNNYLIKTGKDRYIRSGTKQIPRGASFEEITAIITR